jgi:long-chain acyl-CoA synthetase
MSNWLMSIAEAHAQMCAPGERFELETVEIRGVATRTWKNGPKLLTDLLEAARAFGDAEFLVYRDQRVTFSGFERAVAAAAWHLVDWGIRPGDRVAIAMSNRPEWCVAFMAAVATGAVVVPLNGWWTGEELGYGLRDSGSRLLFADGARLRRIAEHAPDELLVISVDDEEAGHPLLSDWIGPVSEWSALPGGALPDIRMTAEDAATIFYTSGTTGSPKGVVGTHRNATSIVLSSAVSGERLRRRGGTLPTPPGQRKVLLAVPLFHVTGCISRFLPALAGGSMLAMLPRWDAEEAISVITREGITATGGVPTIALQLLERVEATGESLPSLQSLSFGGAAAPSALVDRMARDLPGAVPGSGFGMTEAGSMITHHQGGEYVEAPDSSGPAVPVCDIRVVGPEGDALPVGQVGELSVRGPNVFVGYWNREADTAEVLHDGWVRTGDLARLDDVGRCFIVDRIKDVVIRGGENIYCAEVENVLAGIEGVAEVAVFGLPHPTLGEVPIAALQVTGDLDEAAVLEFARSRLSSFKVPERVHLSRVPLPHNAGGKILKAELKLRFS